jgi:hypothetical protein
LRLLLLCYNEQLDFYVEPLFLVGLIYGTGVKNLSPLNWKEKSRIKREMKELPESFVRKTVFMKKQTAARVVFENESAFEGKTINDECDNYLN